MYEPQPRFAIYIKDKEICKLIREQKNKSEYVERAIRFYIDNKDIVSRLANVLLDQKQN